MGILSFLSKYKSVTRSVQSKVVGKTNHGRIIECGGKQYTVVRHFSSKENSCCNGDPRISNSTVYFCDSLSFKATPINQKEDPTITVSFDFYPITNEGDYAHRVPNSAVFYDRENMYPFDDDVTYGEDFFGADVNNINSIRYAMRNNPKVAKFLDQFVIVTSEERQSYRDYVVKQQEIVKEKMVQRE